ncbi:putative peptide-methionine -s-oxide reductase protein [Botrytis fragariae]|uniref:Putative peptide-methionine -s-oxide reductase protein n=1 Tax=Botrytis fragariae TaxID=1964551 RepID=A0A8H6AR55_9HELO|nr:putative peptide-methionine -s-oxide reductase protein [Botrytis fragariae]KAF5872097.1 putative peptide-methionine -s-oxide reductase protein [Botrytis fragariae]
MSNNGPLFFWHPDDADHPFLSQHYICEFTDENGRVYTSSEQKIKSLGRKVKNFDEKEWNKVKFNIVIQGNVFKFSRGGKELREQFERTGDRELVEASPYDKIWGIGIKGGVKECQRQVRDGTLDGKRKEWGKNLLGLAMVEARRLIREKEKSERGEKLAEVHKDKARFQFLSASSLKLIYPHLFALFNHNNIDNDCQTINTMANYDLLANPLAVRNPNPLSLIPYSVATGYYSEESKDVYLTYANIYPHTHVPGIPSPYSQEQLERRALYITGIPSDWSTPAFRSIFELYGVVEKCPMIFDLASKSTFRFVIMRNTEDCLKAKDSIHGLVLENNTIYTTEALPSSSLLRLYNLGLDELGLNADECLNILENNRVIEDFEVGDLDATDQNVALNTQYVYTSATLDQAPIIHGHPSPRTKLPIVKIRAADSETEVEFPPPNMIRKNRPAPLNLVGANNITSRRISPLLPPQSPFPTQTHFESIFENSAPSSSNSLTPTPTQTAFKTQVSTWAAIVSSASPNHRNVDLHPSTPRSGRRLNSIGRIPSLPPSKPMIHEALSQQARVVLILNIPSTMTLSDISNAIHEGPIVCIRFGIDSDTGKRFSGIVFQHASDAQSFFSVLLAEREAQAPNRFRFIADCVRGEPFPINDDIISMSAPTFASRRLTIVKKAFFFAFTGRNLQTLCEKEVGRENVQLVFVYNGGNATVVFAEVSAARKMKSKLERLREGAGKVGGTSSIYEGLQVTFSKDPCELEGGLNLQAADGYCA